jgi:hypothetical protein
MVFQTRNEIKYYQFESFREYAIEHAIFTRHGGVSPAPYDSLNFGGTIGDLDENIIENKKRVFEVLGIPFASQFDVWQVHGTQVVIAEEPRKPLQNYVQADAIITDKPTITLFMRFADCVPILLYEPHKNVAGIVHAGWQGTVNNTVKAAIKRMVSTYNVNAADIVAGIGPSIGPDHYTIREDVLAAFKNRFGHNWQKMIQFEEDKIHLNLWKANELNLLESGVSKIEIANICTACQTQDWFSHRAEAGKTGRFGALIKLLA